MLFKASSCLLYCVSIGACSTPECRMLLYPFPGAGRRKPPTLGAQLRVVFSNNASRTFYRVILQVPASHALGSVVSEDYLGTVRDGRYLHTRLDPASHAITADLIYNSRDQ